MACAEPEKHANLDISCEAGTIQTVRATLVRLPNAEKCEGASFRDGEHIFEAESEMITQQLRKICIGKRDYRYDFEYRTSCDFLEPDNSPLLLRVKCECATGT